MEVEEAYAMTTNLPKGLSIKAGKILLPFGRQNTKHLETWDFADNTLANKLMLGAEGLGELGVEFAYLFPTPFFLELKGSFTNGTNADNFNGNRKEDLLYNARAAASFDITSNTTVLVGASGAWGFNDSGRGNVTNLYGGDLLVKWKPDSHKGLTWQTEYMHRRREEPGVLLQDNAFYTYVDYQFLKRWHTGLRYDHIGFSSDSLANRWRATPAITFNPTEFSRLRAQYEFDKTSGQDGIHAFILQLGYSMGPHGSHPY